MSEPIASPSKRRSKNPPQLFRPIKGSTPANADVFFESSLDTIIILPKKLACASVSTTHFFTTFHNFVSKNTTTLNSPYNLTPSTVEILRRLLIEFSTLP